MATSYKARVEYEVTDTSQLTYSFPFPYLRKAFVSVSVLHADSTEEVLTYATDYTVTDLNVTLVSPLSKGDTLIIERKTSTDKVVTWNDGSILLANDMNLESTQMLHLQEEQQDYIQAHSINTKPTTDNEMIWDANSHRVSNVNDPKDAQDAVTKHYMESVQGGFVSANTILVNQATERATAAKASQDAAKVSETNSASSASASEASNQQAKKWAEDSNSPNGLADTDSTTGKTQSSKSWALYAKDRASASASSASLAGEKATTATEQATIATSKASEANATYTSVKVSEANAKASQTASKTSETNAASSASAAANSATLAEGYKTKAAESAQQAKESAMVFQDFTGATSTADGTSGKVIKPLAGQQDKYLKGDGTWGDVPALTPSTMSSALHTYPNNYVPADTSNAGWNSLGFCSIYYDTMKIKNQPSRYGQLINIPATKDGVESIQLFIVQSSGTLLSRGGNGDIPVNDALFKHVGIDYDTGHLHFPNGAELWVY